MRISVDGLVLRPWRDSDRQPFAGMSADPSVMGHLLPLASRTESDAWIDRQIGRSDQYGFCFWAVEAEGSGAFVGSVGLGHVGYAAAFTPAVEIGWRMARRFWGQGYASKAACAALRFGFEALELTEIVATAAVGNGRSRRVMARIGMLRDWGCDFDHPQVPEGNPLRRQVLYRLSRARWASLYRDQTGQGEIPTMCEWPPSISA